MPFPRIQKGPLTHRQVQTIAYLLHDTDMSEQEIADTFGCTQIGVSSINRSTTYGPRSVLRHQMHLTEPPGFRAPTLRRSIFVWGKGSRARTRTSCVFSTSTNSGIQIINLFSGWTGYNLSLIKGSEVTALQCGIEVCHPGSRGMCVNKRMDL